MHTPLSTPLSRMLHTKGTEVLVHGVAIDTPDQTLHIVLEGCDAYWVDSHFGHINGPWCTLEAALRNTPAGELRAGEVHDLFSPKIDPQVLLKMMILEGNGRPDEVTINGEEWTLA